ncbi:molybdopterin-dependent oxidoreductase [Candidatus Uabimicrobium sp. HlEnr_7]|uniref:molybdopterin-dependent oxidoreductase n=1 Tax=Candidatus Uabimicrobium helgolandensis TaxID=3095367 RepID=UPI00355650D9
MKNEDLKVVGDSGASHNCDLLNATLNWQIRIHGEIHYPQIMNLSQLWSLPTQEVSVKIECVSAGKIYGNKPAIFAGVTLRTLIDLVCPQQNIKTIIFTSEASGSCGPSTQKHYTALDYEYCYKTSDVIVSGCLNNQPLPYKNGGPLRLIAGCERYFYKSLKWLSEIEFSTKNIDECLGTWEKYAGYHNYARIIEKERFSPFLREITHLDDRGNIESLRELPENEHDVFIKNAHQKKDLSQIVAAKIKWPHKDFNDCLFSKDKYRAQLRGINFAKASFLNANMSRANFSLSLFREALFSDKGKHSATLDECDCEGASFIRAHLENVSMKKAFLLNVRFYPDSNKKKYNARVKGLDLTGSVGIDSKQLQWLREDGAIIDNVVTQKTPTEDYGYLPMIQIDMYCAEKHEDVVLKMQESQLFHKVISSKNSSQIKMWGYTHKKNDINKFLCELSVVYNKVLFTVSQNPVWLLSTMRS